MVLKGIDLVIDNLKTELADLKQKISEARKSGIDTLIVDLKIMHIPSKIGVAEATRSFTDVRRIKSMIDDASRELVESTDEERRTRPMSVAESQEAMNALIEGVHLALEQNDMHMASEMYDELRGLYLFVPDNMKKETYKKCLHAYKDISKYKKKR